MKKLIFLLVIGGALWHYRAQLPWNSSPSAFNEDGSAKALLIVADICGRPCELMEDHLDKLRVEYELKSIDPQDADQLAELHQYTKGANVLPVLVMGEKIITEYSEFELPFEVADALGMEYLPSDQAEIINKAHFNDDGSRKVVLYGTRWCGYCKKARELLDKEGIAFEDVDVEDSGESMRRYKTLGGNGYPLIFSGAKALSGFDAKKLLKLAEAK